LIATNKVKKSQNNRSQCKSIDDACNPKDRACHSTSCCTFEIPVFEPSYYHIYRRLKSKRVGFKKLNSARYFNISNLLMLRMTLSKLCSLPLQYTTETLHIVNEIMRNKKYLTSYWIKVYQEMLSRQISQPEWIVTKILPHFQILPVFLNPGTPVHTT
jgi:hypothetical protein